MPFSNALLTDLYQLTMAYGYWKSSKERDEAVFHLYFRENPFEGGYTIAAGLEEAVRYIESLRFRDDDLQFLSTVLGNDNRPLFPADFLRHLEQLRFTLDIDAVPEGTVVFPQEAMLRVVGPILQAQIVETALLNMINFQSLIATKASRVVYAAKGDPVILVRPDTSTADIPGFAIAAGIVTAVGARTSHAALVARQMDKPCVVGCSEITIDAAADRAIVAGKPIVAGDWITVDGEGGRLFLGQLATVVRRPDAELAEIASWKSELEQPTPKTFDGVCA